MEFNGKTLTAFGEFEVVGGGVDEAHINDKNNPHEVTAAQVGAAPAGFGLGESSSPSTSWGVTSKNGYVRANTASPDGAWWYGLNIKYDQTIAAQIAIKRVTDKSAPIVAIRHRPDYGESTPWGAWEYVNPPMLFGVEYRTAERWNGKPVYTKLIDLGEHFDFTEGNPFGEEEEVVTLSGISENVDVITDATFRRTDGIFYSFNTDGWDVAVEDNTIHFNLYNTGEYFESATLLLKYTKI